jgi:small subunit ribosomal protein S6
LAQKLYECMFLIDSGRYAVDARGTEDALVELLTRVGAEIIHKMPWQEGKLAYPVDGHKKGLHYLVLFKMDGSQGVEFNRLCKLSEVVIRQLLIQHPPTIFHAMVEAVREHNTGGAHAAEAPAQF